MTQPWDIAAQLEWRAARDEFFRGHYASPLPDEHLSSFAGLRYFAPDPALMLRGSFAPAEGTIDIVASTGGTTAYDLAGHAELLVGGTPCRLVVLHGEEAELFIPFRDETSGTTTYGGGRYAPAVTYGTNEVTVDFNRAINPYCAYDEEFSCPLPPAENWLPTAVTAGEMTYEHD